MGLEEKLMRSLAITALFGSLLCIANLKAQNLAEHAAAAAGATIGTAAGKPMSSAINKIFDQNDDQTKAASKNTIIKPAPATNNTPTRSLPAPTAGAASGFSSVGQSAGGSSAGSSESSAPRHARSGARRVKQQPDPATDLSADFGPPPIAVEPPPPPNEPTAEQVAGIQVGASEDDVIAALGQPASRVVIPDDDGHLRESFQFWAKGSQLGTVRLDNGYVVKVEARRF